MAPFTLGWPVLRRAALRLGEGLVGAGVLGARDEVFFLTEGEVAGALRGGAGAGGGGAGLPEAAARRRQEWERRRALAPPLRLGRPRGRSSGGWSGSRPRWRPPPARPRALRGRPASPGRATGPVRLIRGPAEFGALRPGEVLVAPATAPAWTPLFARAAAVVTDTGGVLAHTSLVAREYGIPAVVGTGDATVRLRSGQVVTVDGDAGVVQVHPRA